MIIQRQKICGGVCGENQSFPREFHARTLGHTPNHEGRLQRGPCRMRRAAMVAVLLSSAAIDATKQSQKVLPDPPRHRGEFDPRCGSFFHFSLYTTHRFLIPSLNT